MKHISAEAYSNNPTAYRCRCELDRFPPAHAYQLIRATRHFAIGRTDYIRLIDKSEKKQLSLNDFRQRMDLTKQSLQAMASRTNYRQGDFMVDNFSTTEFFDNHSMKDSYPNQAAYDSMIDTIDRLIGVIAHGNVEVKVSSGGDHIPTAIPNEGGFQKEHLRQKLKAQMSQIDYANLLQFILSFDPEAKDMSNDLQKKYAKVIEFTEQQESQSNSVSVPAVTPNPTFS